MRNVVICASGTNGDRKGLEELLSQLSGPRQRGEIRAWDRSCVPPGTNIESAVRSEMAAANVIVLLISANLLNDCDADVQLALEQRQRGAHIIPVRYRPTFISGSQFDGLQFIPEKDPISSARDPEAEWVKVVEAILNRGDTKAPQIPSLRPSPAVLKMLILGADRSDAETSLELPREVKAIRAGISAQQKLDAFRIEQELATTRKELLQLLLREKPNILHFSGHGTRAGQLVLLDNSGVGVAVDTNVLTGIFRTCATADGFDIRCVVLSACYTEVQARAIAAHAPCVIGISGEIPIDSAREFAAIFYAAAASGQNVQSACEFGRLQAGLETNAGSADGIQIFTRPDINPRSYKLLG